MIILPIPRSLKIHAKHLAAKMIEQYRGNRDSIKNGEGHYHAKIVELLLVDNFDVQHTDTYHHDVIVHAEDGNSYLTENKVKRRKYAPKPHWLASVCEANISQQCDYYLFASLLKEETCFLMVIIRPDEFKAKAFKALKGDTEDGTEFEFKADCRNLPYSALQQLNLKP